MSCNYRGYLFVLFFWVVQEKEIIVPKKTKNAKLISIIPNLYWFISIYDLTAVAFKLAVQKGH